MFHWQHKRSLYVDTTYAPATTSGEKEADGDTVMAPASTAPDNKSSNACPPPAAAVSPTAWRPIPPPLLDGESRESKEVTEASEQKRYDALPAIDGRHCVPRARNKVHLHRYRPISPAEEEAMQSEAIVLREHDFGIAPATGEDLLVDTHYVCAGRRRRMREGDVVEVGGRLYVASGDGSRKKAEEIEKTRGAAMPIAAPIGGGGRGAPAPALRPTPPTERRRHRHRHRQHRRRTTARELLSRGIRADRLLDLVRRRDRRDAAEQGAAV